MRNVPIVFSLAWRGSILAASFRFARQRGERTASSQEYHDYVLELLAGVEGVRTRKMMGEYIVYLDDVVVGGIYDDELLLKPFECLDALFPDAQRRLPYEGSKTMMVVVDSEDPSFLTDVFETLRGR